MAEAVWPGERLVAAARDGDAVALAALVSGAHPHVNRFARSLCASREDAEDAAQEALVILYRKVGMLRASAALASWMFRIVRHECWRLARSVVRGTPVVEAVEEPAPSAEREALSRISVERIAAVVAALPDEQRRVLVMRDVQGLSGRVTADALGLSVPAMKSRLHRARAAVQAALEVSGG